MKLDDSVVFKDYSGQKINNETIYVIGGTGEITNGETLHLYKSNTSITLGEKIGKKVSGEGQIFKTNLSWCVAKIYHEKHRTNLKEKKLKKMIEYENDNEHVCWPSDVIYKDGKFVGFLMPIANGKTLDDICDHPSDWERLGLNKEKQVQMIIEILNTFKWLHEKNIIVGDIKLENIMFDEKTFHTYFVDMDSVQIEEFPCTTTTEGYDSPEALGFMGRKRCNEKDEKGEYMIKRYYAQNYRTKEMETFSLATLIYFFLMNQFPYENSDYGGDEGDFNENHLLKLDRKFPYSMKADEYANGERIKLAKDGTDMRYAHDTWSHLPSFIKQLFVDTFYKSIRYKDDKWILAFEQYKEYLAKKDLKDEYANCLIVPGYNVIEYENVMVDLEKTISKKGFRLKPIISKIFEELKSKASDEQISGIANHLKDCKVCKLGKYQFKLEYNIGILKRVKCTYNSVL